MEIRFTNPEFLRLFIILPVIIAFHFFSIGYKKRRALKFANFEAIERVIGSELISRNIVILFLNLIIVSTLIFAAAGMILWYEQPVSTYNYIIGIDASGSMAADDFSPDRLTVAKEISKDFVSKLPRTTNVGVISFSGVGFIEKTPSQELSKVINAIDSISIKTIGGTDLNEAIIIGTNLLLILEDTRPKSIILLTDGQITAGVELIEVIDYAKKHNIIIHTIGVGTLEGGNLPSGGISKLDAQTLQALSYNTGGLFFLANDTQAIREAYQEFTKPLLRNTSTEISGFLIILTFFLFVFNWWLSNMRYESIP